jgi:hypothetical protein
MALKYLTHLNLNQNELQNPVIHPLGTAPSTPTEGQIYYNSTTGNKRIYVYDGSAWSSIAGDITEVIAGDGLSGGGNSDSVTLAVNVDDSTIEINSDTLRVKAGGITANELASTTVTAGSYGSSSAIPTFTVDADGRLTAAGTAAVSTTLDIAADSGTDDGVVLGTDTLTSGGTTNEIETSVSGDTITIGLPDNVTIGNNLTVTGDLTVSGTTTTINTETIELADNIIVLNSNETGTPSQNAGIEVERGTSTNVDLRWNETNDAWELTNDGTNYYNISTEGDSYKASIGDGTTLSYTVNHNLGSRDVLVELYDASSYETVIADITRTDTNNVTVAFTNAPTLNDIRVLIRKI